MGHRKTENVDSSPVASVPASGRDPNGRFAAGNVAAMVHGGRSRQVRTAALPIQADVRATLASKRAAIASDLGGEGNLTQLQQDLINRYVETDAVADYLAGTLVTAGALTPRGRSRAALTAYLQVLDRQHRLAVALGLERRAKAVATPHEYWQQRVATPSADDPEVT